MEGYLQQEQHESPKSHIREFFDLTEEEKEQLKERVAQWDGFIRWFVHPMFEKWRGHESKYINDPKMKKMVDIERVFKLMLEMDSDSTPPIFISEERRYRGKFNEWIEQLSEIKNDIYVIDTYSGEEGDGSAVPMPPKSMSNDWQSHFFWSCGWDWKTLRQRLTEVGVKKILLGGMLLEVNSYHGKVIYNKCVGTTLYNVSNEEIGDFEVEVSALTHPQSRLDVKKEKDNLNKK